MDETADQNHDNLGPQKAVPGSVFIEIKSVPLRSNARDLRLRDGDVIVAIDGVACHIDITEFEDLLLDARDDETSVLVTIGRDQIFFEIFMASLNIFTSFFCIQTSTISLCQSTHSDARNLLELLINLNVLYKG